MMWLDGSPVTASQVAGLALVNYGHFTTMLVRGHRVRGLRLHLDRLVRDCSALFGTELDPDLVRTLARRAAAVGPDPTVLRITLFDPGLELARPARTAGPRVLVTLRPVPPDDPAPVRLRTVRYTRESAAVKHSGLFGAVYQRRAAQLAGYDDALFVDGAGRVVEGPTWNIGFLDETGLTWPDAECLAGVTMRLLDGVLAGLGAVGRTVPVTPAELPGRYAAVITSSAIGVRPVGAVDGVTLPTAPDFVERLRRAYARIEPEPL